MRVSAPQCEHSAIVLVGIPEHVDYQTGGSPLEGNTSPEPGYPRARGQEYVGHGTPPVNLVGDGDIVSPRTKLTVRSKMPDLSCPLTAMGCRVWGACAHASCIMG